MSYLSLYKIILVLALSATCLFTQNSFAEDYSCCENTSWVMRFEAAGALGQFIGQNRKYAEIGLFTGPAPCNDFFFFTDLRGYWLANDHHRKNHAAASAGLGARMLDRNSQRIWGANVYYDYMEARYGGFNQIGIGLESLGTSFDFRINGYLPLKTSQKSSLDKTFYPGGFGYLAQEKEFSYKGIDAEVGYHIWENCNFGIYGAIGPYYYHNSGLPKVYGGQFRLELSFLDYLTLEGAFSDDNHYHAQIQGKLTVSIPLDELLSCFCGKDRCRAFFTQPVKRNGLAFFKRCCNAKWNW